MLIQYLESCGNKVFEYGQYDCALFVADYLKLATGKDYAKKYRGKYDSQAKGLKKIKGDLRKYVGTVLDGPYPINHARAGDIALRILTIKEQLKVNKAKMQIADTYGDDREVERLQNLEVEDGITLGIVHGRYVYGPTDIGIGKTPLSEWQEIYRA